MRIEPYRSNLHRSEVLELDVVVRNPFAREAVARVELAVPAGWQAPSAQELALAANAEGVVRFSLRPGGPGERMVVAADLTVDGIRFGQQAEALVDVA